MPHRREFLKTSLLAALASAMPARLLGSEEPPEVRVERVEGAYLMRISQNEALKTDWGSVRFSVGQMMSVGMLRLTRTPGPVFYTVSEICTHQGCIIGNFNPTTHRFVCGCHLSAFSAAGDVLQSPARTKLPSYVTTFDGTDTISIEIPGLLAGVHERQPVAMSLHESHPNPAASATTLEYSLSATAYVVLSICSSSGSEVLRIEEGRRDAGQHQTGVDLTSVPAGAYFVRLTLSTGEMCVRNLSIVR